MVMMCVLELNQSTADRWEEQYGAGATETAAEAAAGADFAMLCIGADKDVLAVVEQIKSSLKPGAIVIDHTTASPECARQCAKSLADIGVAFLDAPISGGQSGAENGKLSIMCGGDTEAFQTAQPIMESYGQTITHLGPVGSGQLAKCVNQICIAGTLQGLSEGIMFAKAAGIDPERLLKRDWRRRGTKLADG